jgi:hypothetical protein
VSVAIGDRRGRHEAGHPGRRASKLADRGSACRTRSPPGRLNPAGLGAADCASLAQPALHHKRMVVCPIPDHERRPIKAGNFSVWPRDRDPGAALDAALAAFAGVVEEEG